MVFSTSGITLTSPTEIPRELSQVANALVFKSFVLPDNTSLPIMIIAADISFLLVISMISMEVAMNITDYVLTGGAMLTWWVVPIMLAVGFVTPWPYNYWRLKKHNQACH